MREATWADHATRKLAWYESDTPNVNPDETEARQVVRQRRAVRQQAEPSSLQHIGRGEGL